MANENKFGTYLCKLTATANITGLPDYDIFTKKVPLISSIDNTSMNTITIHLNMSLIDKENITSERSEEWLKFLYENTVDSTSVFSLSLKLRYVNGDTLLRQIDLGNNDILPQVTSTTTVEEAIELSKDHTIKISLDETMRGKEVYLDAVEMAYSYDSINYTDAEIRLRDAITPYDYRSIKFKVNAIPVFTEPTKQPLVYALFGPNQEKYTKDERFFNNFRMEKFSTIEDTDIDDTNLAIAKIYYKKKLKGETKFSNLTYIKDLDVIYNSVSNKTSITDFTLLTKELNIEPEAIIQFSIILTDGIEEDINHPNWTSGTYTKANILPPSKPVFLNLKEGQEFVNGNVVNGIFMPNLVVPYIQVNDDYVENYEYVTATYSIDNGITWLPTKLELVEIIGPEYDVERNPDGTIKLDENGNVIIKKDPNGKPIIVKPPVTQWMYIAIKGFNTPGNYKVIPRITNSYLTANILGDMLNIKVNEYVYVEPVILVSVDGVTKRPLLEGEVFSGNVFLDYKDDARLSTIFLYLDGVNIPRNMEISVPKKYSIRIMSINAISSDTVEITKNFTISNELPPAIEVYGVTDNSQSIKYDIHVIKSIGCTMKITYKDLNNSQVFTPSLANSSHANSEGVVVASFFFSITRVGTYDLNILSTHNGSKLTRTLTINNFSVIKESVTDDLIQFNPLNPSVHSTVMSLIPGNAKNKLTFNEDGGSNHKYLSPLLYTRNLLINASENTGNTITKKNKRFSGILRYTPELPNVLDVKENGVYYTTRNIRFTNTASKPSQARYYIFIDGKLINNPFTTTTVLKDDGYHFITILGWDNVSPSSYVYKSFRFLIREEIENLIRKPSIIVSENKKQGTVTITVNFSKIHPNAVHTLKLKYLDNTEEVFTYPYNIGKVIKIVDRNCIVIASTKLMATGLELTDTKTITTIYDTAPSVTDIKIFGIVEKTIHTTKFGDFKVNIGPIAILDFIKSHNEIYDVYVNGLPYTVGTLIENKEEELRKYTIEIIITNKFDKTKKSYYSNQFVLDSLALAFPHLTNYTEYLMNRTDIDRMIDMKHEENINEMTSILNSRIIDVKAYIIKKDDEYILTMTYVYYNGCKRTNSFYFSINTNTVDEIKPLKIVLKALDYNNEEVVAKDGELIIDRVTGHLWYNKNTIITPITKHIEDAILDVEKKLFNIEQIHLKFNYYYDVSKEIALYYIKKKDEFIKSIKDYLVKLNSICTELDTIKSNVNKLDQDIKAYSIIITNNANYIAGTSKTEITTLTTSVQNLNNNFELLLGRVKTTLERGAVVKDDTFYLRDEIKKRVTIEKYNNWKAEEDAKYNRFVNYVNNFYA